MWLLDTNVISEMRKIRTGKADAHVKQWSRTTYLKQMYLSTITVFEMETGIQKVRRKDLLQAELLQEWLHQQVLPDFTGRILPVDTDIALRCAALHVPATASYRDSFIAATALVQGLIVVTRNTKDFAPMGVKILNPWEA